MIRIRKKKSPPIGLKKKGDDLREAMEVEFSADSESFRQGKKTFKFKSSVYGAKKVKEQLKLDQYQKCCYCEGKSTAFSYGDVEHFRPKGAYIKRGETQKSYPGYFWLAYEWDNLYYSCQICNQSYKGNHFPLTEETERCSDPGNPLEPIESCLLIDPGKEDPEVHIRFEHEIPVPKTDKGKSTISLLGLDREELNEFRRGQKREFEIEYWISTIDLPANSDEDLAPVLNVFNLKSREELADKIEKANKRVEFMLSDKGEFSLMNRYIEKTLRSSL